MDNMSKRYFLVSTASLSLFFSACSSKQSTHTADYNSGTSRDPAGAPATAGGHSFIDGEIVGGPVPVAMGECKAETLNQIQLAPGLSVNQAMNNLHVYGTIYGNWGADRMILAPWFAAGYTGSGSEIWEASRYSKAAYRINSYLNGQFGNYMGQSTYQDYIASAKMTAGMASMIAAAKTHPGCVAFIRSKLTSTLGPYATELDVFKLTENTELARTGKIGAEFKKTDAKKVQLEKTYRSLDKQYAKEEKNDQRSFRRKQSEIKRELASLRTKFAKITACRNIINLREIAVDGTEDVRERIDNAAAECDDRLEEELEKIQDKRQNLVDSQTKLKEKENDATVPARLEAIEKSIAALDQKTADIQAMKDSLIDCTEQSIGYQMDRISSKFEDIENRVKSGGSESMTRLQQQMAETQKELAMTSVNWLGQGYMGQQFTGSNYSSVYYNTTVPHTQRQRWNVRVGVAGAIRF